MLYIVPRGKISRKTKIIIDLSIEGDRNHHNSETKKRSAIIVRGKKNCFKLKNRAGHRKLHFLDNAEADGAGTNESSDDGTWLGMLNYVNEVVSGALKVQLLVDEKYVKYELDTGACATVISENDYLSLFKHSELKEIFKPIEVVTGERVVVLGSTEVMVKSKRWNNRMQLPTLVIICKNKCAPLLWQNWLDHLYPNWRMSFVQEITYNRKA